jgi:ribosomal protein S12 methylthiotransferase
LFEPLEDGFVFTGGPYAYLKLGEGCMHACAFCAIPGIRGKLRSRKPAAIIEEARQLIKRGYKELNIVAQDISSYGEDFKDGTTLAGLLKELDKLQGDLECAFYMAILQKLQMIYCKQ